MKTLYTKGGYCRNQPDLNACTHARKQTILPIIFDPSHVSGDHRIVSENLMAACGHLVDGSITETIHTEKFRQDQLCDASQAMVMDAYCRLVEAVLAFEQHVQPHLLAINRQSGAL
jgi:3-deoxy-7-phosphoheptulonate synthase